MSPEGHPHYNMPVSSDGRKCNNPFPLSSPHRTMNQSSGNSSAIAAGEAARVAGNEHFAAQRYSEAVQKYTEAQIKNPWDAAAVCNRATAYSKLKQWAHAYADAERAVDIAEGTEILNSQSPKNAPKLVQDVS